MALLLALGVPLLLGLLGVRLLQNNRSQRPGWLAQLSRREAVIWNAGIGLIMGLSLLRWLLGR